MTRAGYYAWRARKESARRKQDHLLLGRIQAVYEASDGTYGSPRIQRALAANGIAISRRRVERLMRQLGLRARVARVYRSKPGRYRLFTRYSNLLWKQAAQRPGQVWVADITYLQVRHQWRFLAVVMDQYSRRLLGWSLGRVRNGELTRAAFDHALTRGTTTPRLILHSDRGSEYAGAVLGQRLRKLGVRQSMTRGGSPSDNAHAESFFHSLKAEATHGIAFPDDHTLRQCLSRYVRFYNHHRLHSSLGYLTPVAFERQAA